MNPARASTFTIATLTAVALTAVPVRGAPARAGAVADTSSALTPADSGYVEAQTLARLLEERGIHTRRLSRSKVAGFMGERRAASYSTDRGNFAVVFFPPPDGAERVRITSEVRDGHYLYTYGTDQPGLRREQREDHDAPQCFVVHGRWFIFVWDGATEWWLRHALAHS
jgi:hypothetical protein